MPDPLPTRPSGLGRVPAIVLAATVAFALLGTWWSVLAPLGEAPDEPAHLALVLHLAEGHPYPDYDGLENPAAIIRLCRTFASATRACPRPGESVTPTSTRRHPAADAPDKATRPAWDDEGGDELVGQLNQMPQHPPLYYRAMAIVLRAERAVLGGPASADRELALLRLANVALLAPLPVLCWWAARRFGLDDATAPLAALAVLGVPMLSHIGSTLNNDNLLTLLATVLVVQLAGVLRGDRSRRTAVGIGVIAALALLTKAFAVVFPPIILLAYLVGRVEGDARGWRDRARSVVVPVAIAGSVTLVGAGWWYVRVRSRTGSFTPTTEGQRYSRALRPPGFEPELGRFAEAFASNLNQRFWGSFGWYTVRFPGWLVLLCTSIVVAAVVTALAPRRDPSGSSRGQRAVFLAPMTALGALVGVRAWNLHVTTGQFPFIQGRYLFPGIAGVVVLVAVGVRRWAGRWSAVAVLIAALALQAEAVRRCLEVWWGGPGLGPRGQGRALVAWSGWPGELILVIVLGLTAALAWLVVATARSVGSRAR